MYRWDLHVSSYRARGREYKRTYNAGAIIYKWNLDGAHSRFSDSLFGFSVCSSFKSLLGSLKILKFTVDSLTYLVGRASSLPDYHLNHFHVFFMRTFHCFFRRVGLRIASWESFGDFNVLHAHWASWIRFSFSSYGMPSDRVSPSEKLCLWFTIHHKLWSQLVIHKHREHHP